MFRIEPRLQKYDWGMGGTIPAMLGLAPVDGPVAEAWWGTHPSAPSPMGAPGSGDLAQAVAADPQGLLGEGLDELPFLLKVLAIAKPLSIQVHPTAAQARAGYDRESATGVPVDAPARTFRDPRHKPEMIVAITRMRLLSGFRGPGAVARDVAGLMGDDDALVAALGSPDDVRSYVVEALDGPPRPDLLSALAGAPDDDSAIGFAGRAARAFPGDRGALVALAMNPVVLVPGEASFIPARQVHNYQSGVGVEIMANSDNVVRGGLTPKPVDVARFEAVVNTAASGPIRPEVDEAEGSTTYRAPVTEFALTRVDRGTVDVAAAPRIVLAVDGGATITSDHATMSLDAGQAAFAGASDGPITVTATALAFVAMPGADRA